MFLVGGMRVIDHSITMGTLVAFIAYQMRLVWPIQALMGLYASLASARVSLRRVNEILDAPLDVDGGGRRRLPMPRARGHVTLDDVTFASGAATAVLDRVSLVVPAGERWRSSDEAARANRRSPICSSGSSIRRRGRVMLDGVDLRSIRLARRAPQHTRRRPRAIRLQRHDRREHSLCSARVRATPKCVRRRMRRDSHRSSRGCRGESTTSAGERGRGLSAGERQRSAIARAFLADPAVLVLDEATGALDPATEAQVAAGYEAVMRGRTTIIITHRLELARRADRVVVLERGRLVEDGRADALLDRTDSTFASLFASGTLQETR